MKVHPSPKMRNITLQYDIASFLSSATSLSCRLRKLRRLPHIFAKVLELPFPADADVTVLDTPDSLRFVVPTDDDDAFAHDVRAITLEIYPGVTKIVILRGAEAALLDSPLGDFELDIWRFRLPASTLPELASAVYRDGELVVTVPKGGDEDEGDDVGVIGPGQLVLVQ